MTRLTGLPTLRVDPTRELAFEYAGRAMTGVAGDTVASAMFANGVRVFSRSLKYHRPRGLYSLDGECANTMMAINDIPNTAAETTPLAAGMRVGPQNVRGSADRDPLSFLDKFDWAMPAGFYYRLMHKPAAIWPIAAEQIRKMAGLGVMEPDHPTVGRYDETYLNAEVCVVGAGPAGMQAALAAAQYGARVVLLERRPWLGGSFEHRLRSLDDGTPAYQRARDLATAVAADDNIRVFHRTALIGIYNDNLVTAFQRGEPGDGFDERYVEIRAASLVVATGCIERPLLFENNERPGVMQVGCAHRLAHTYGLLPGRTAVFSVGSDAGLECAADLADQGVAIACVADCRTGGHDPALVDALRQRDVSFLAGWVATAAHGRKTVRGVSLAALDGTRTRDESCDVLVASAGRTPLAGPVTMAQGKLAYDSHTGCFLPAGLPARLHVAGRLTGLEDAAAIEMSGLRAGLSAAADCGHPVERELRECDEQLGRLPGPAAGSGLVRSPTSGRKSFVCFDEDATVKNVRQAIDQGFDVPELIKRFASVGTGPGQGGLPGHNLPMLVAELRGLPVESASPTTMRAPMVPVSMATLAGSSHDMCKRTPVHDSQKLPGAIVRRIGAWRRVRYFSDDLRCRDEVRNVRTNVGMLDGSSLGKFRLWGPDALKALQRIYVSDMGKLQPGRVKYSAMCNDDGCLVDDGVVIKRADGEYYLTTSSGRAGQTVEWFRYHTRYDGWDFKMVNLTDALGVINLAGPNARTVLERVTDADVSNDAFPFAGYREFTLLDSVPARVLRLGFVGELSFELHVPSSYMQAVWDGVAAAGADLGIANFGVEAQNIMRMEKGHLIIGSESEQRTTLNDLGLGFLWSRKKPEARTVGSVALAQTLEQPDRLKLVGFRMDNPEHTPRDGSIVVDKRIRGWVCIARDSEALSQSVGMALVDAPLSAEGTTLRIYEDGCGGDLATAHVVPMPFYDPDGARIRM